MIIKNPLRIVYLIPIILIFLRNSFSYHILGIDVEASGSSFVKNGILSIGCSLQNEESTELMSFQLNLSLPDGRDYERECLENFWLKHPEAHKRVQVDPIPPKEAMKQFCQFLNNVENKYADLMLVSDNPGFDVAWINTYLSLFTDRKPLDYAKSGEYRMIWDSASVQKTWMSIKIGDFDSRHGHIKKLGFLSNWEHDHSALNDARRIADFFNQTRREMKDFAHKILKKVEVVPYNPEWPSMFESEATIIKKALEGRLESIHHVGSTSVTDLAAKPIIDIILELSDDVGSLIESLESIGYKYKGEFNIPMRRFFGKKKPFEVNLHVYERNNPEILLNLKFRDFLRNSEMHRLRYESLKMKLILDPSSHEKVGGFTAYTLGKNEFIKSVIKQTDFNEICPRFCTHFAEWEAYHAIRIKSMGLSSDDKYDKESPLYSSKTDHHVVIYQGTSIIGAMHINMLEPDTAEVKFFHFENIESKEIIQDKIKYFMEKWSAAHNRKLVWKI